MESVKTGDHVWVAGITKTKTGRTFSAEQHRVQSADGDTVTLATVSECLGNQKRIFLSQVFRSAEEAVETVKRRSVEEAEKMEAAARDIRNAAASGPQYRPNFGTT